MKEQENIEYIAQELMNSFIKLNNSRRKKRSDRFGIKRSEFFLLNLLYHNVDKEQGMKVSDISSALEITPAAVTHMINSLEDLGYVKRINHPTDRRVVLISLTQKGFELTEKMHQEFYEDSKDLVNYLGTDKSFELIKLLKLSIKFYQEKK
ncbi:MarR family winged helix-turn-helix transcriptional regulator [Caldicellulosiruptoraceae bacterium PP1]